MNTALLSAAAVAFVAGLLFHVARRRAPAGLGYTAPHEQYNYIR